MPKQPQAASDPRLRAAFNALAPEHWQAIEEHLTEIIRYLKAAADAPDLPPHVLQDRHGRQCGAEFLAESLHTQRLLALQRPPG